MKDWNTKSDPVFDKFNNVTTGKLSTIEARYASTDFLRFDLDRIYELAKPFTNAQQMIDFKGENEKLVNAAGRYLQYNWKGQYPRPDWFEEIYRGESVEECIQIIKDNCTTSQEIYQNGYQRILNRLWKALGKKETRKRLDFIQWGRIDWTDQMLYDVLSGYETAMDCKKSPDKTVVTRLQVYKEKYPKAYALYNEKKTGHTGKRAKRGNYKQRTPPIIQCNLDKHIIKIFKTWDDVENAGFKRSSVASAIRGTDGHNKHKGFLWRHEGQDFTK